jgi:hypothetical protein
MSLGLSGERHYRPSHQSTFLKLNDHLIKPLNAQKFGLNESLITIIVRSNAHLIKEKTFVH